MRCKTKITAALLKDSYDIVADDITVGYKEICGIVGDGSGGMFDGELVGIVVVTCIIAAVIK